eukprot:scaffold15810_cov117-Isochrysis_galbana.AAC.4
MARVPQGTPTPRGEGRPRGESLRLRRHDEQSCFKISNPSRYPEIRTARCGGCRVRFAMIDLYNNGSTTT